LFDSQTKALFNLKPAADEPKKLEVRRYMDAGKGTKVVKRKAPPKPLIKSKPRAKKVVAPKPVKAKTQVKKVVAKKPAAKPLFAKKPAAKPLFAKKPAAKKPIVAKKKPIVAKKKPTVRPKPMMSLKPKPAKRAPAKRAPARRTRKASISTGMSLQETANLGYYAIIAGGFLLSAAILPGIADVALEAIGIAYTLYFTYNYCLFEESRDEFKSTLVKIEDTTGLDIPAFFDIIIGAATSVTDKINVKQSEPKAYPKKDVVIEAKKETESTKEAATEEEEDKPEAF